MIYGISYVYWLIYGSSLDLLLSWGGLWDLGMRLDASVIGRA